MTSYLCSANFPCDTVQAGTALDKKLAALLQSDYGGDFYALFAHYRRILTNSQRWQEWPAIHDKLRTLFMCGRAVPLDGPMMGISVSIRDSVFFRKITNDFGRSRSTFARIGAMAAACNDAFADTGLWAGKIFGTVSREMASRKCQGDAGVMAAYDERATRIGCNFFREPANPDLIQTLGLLTLNRAWNLKDRDSPDTAEIDKLLRQQNPDQERMIPYSKTGGFFLANMGKSVVSQMCGKQVYTLNYLWPNLYPAFPMTCLVDEIVQVDKGIYLGQMALATRHVGPAASCTPDSGYQNNGYFLMMNPADARQIYADAAFPQLRPRPGENGYKELGYDQPRVCDRPNKVSQGIVGYPDAALSPKTAFDRAKPQRREEIHAGILP